MPFGLTNAPSTFQSLMNQVFRPFLRKSILVFFNDILIYSKTWQEHVAHVDQTIQILREHRLYAKKYKYSFGKQEIDYLGHIISKKGVKVDPHKITDMQNWPVPTTLKSLQGFLGLIGYYMKFVKYYGKIVAPLTMLLKKNAFQWSPQVEAAFLKLKDAMCTTPVLVMPNFSKTFMIESDAYGVKIGAVLMQEGCYLAFTS